MREDFESESNDNNMRADVSDRGPQRERSKPRTSMSLSRQHIKIGIGILVLLLFILLMSSALNSPTSDSVTNSQPREVNLGNTSANAPQSPTDINTPAGPQPGSTTLLEIGAPPISGMPTQSPPLLKSPNQQRVEIPGEITDALSAQQEQINRLKETEILGSSSQSGETQSSGSQITTSSDGLSTTSHQNSANQPTQVNNKPIVETKAQSTKEAKISTTASTLTTSSKASSARGSMMPGSMAELTVIPASHVTLQVSSASRSDTLLAFAKKNNMTDYWVYPTRRDGKPWFILVTGNYASSSEARAALSTLPKDVQTNKPWVRSVQQVQQDLKQK